MKRVPNHLFHCLVVAAVAVLAAAVLAACGGSGDDTQELEFQVSVKGKNRVQITAPESADAGLAEVTYGNNSKGPADLQLIRVEGDHSAKEVAAALTNATAGKPYPDWFFAAGGIGLTQPGEIVSAQQVLQPGTYYAFDTEGGISDQAPAFEVGGDASDDGVPKGKGTVEAAEYVFKSRAPLPAGTNEIRFENVGAQPHHMIAAKLIGDTTAKEVEEYFRNPKKGKSGLNAGTMQTTAVIEGGESQLVSFDLEPGRYAFYCFITDRQGGEVHALKGMVDELEVK